MEKTRVARGAARLFEIRDYRRQGLRHLFVLRRQIGRKQGAGAGREFEQTIGLPRQEDSVYIMRDIVSRKKQLMPILSEIVVKYRGH